MLAFLARYLGAVDPRYKSIGALLVDMFRHPLIHTSLSRSYQVGRGYILKSAIYWEEDTRRRRSLVARRKAHLVRKTYKGRDFLVINDHVLHDDVVQALSLYRADLLSGRHHLLARRFSNGYRQATAVVSVASLRPAKKTPQGKKKPQGTLAGTLFRQIGKVRRWPAARVKCFAAE
jgi:hypothetical protein